MASTSVPDPLTSVHVPTAGKITALPSNWVALEGKQSSRSGPALALLLPWSKRRMLTSSVVTPLAQGPLLTVQAKMFSPTPRSVTVVVAAFGEEMVPWPLTKVQVPVAGKINALPVRVVMVFGVHSS